MSHFLLLGFVFSPMEITDQLDRKISFTKPFLRIVSLVPSQTELLIDLKLAEEVLGVTKFCIHPSYLRSKKTVVGGTKSVNFDKISALNPDIILCNKEENTKEIVAHCEKIATVHITDIKTLDDVYLMVEQYGKLFDREVEAGVLIRKLQYKAENFKNNFNIKPPKKVAYLIWKEPWMVAGGNTFINTLLRVNGFINCFEKHDSRYPEIDLGELQDVDLILLSSEPFPFKQKHLSEIKKFTSAQVSFVDGEYFSWYGSRLLGAFDYFMQLHASYSDV
ncbi:MAG: helical backbone metal receptor [Leeuwenhoekiella sp.]